jgi:hypothetical protein
MARVVANRLTSRNFFGAVALAINIKLLTINSKLILSSRFRDDDSGFGHFLGYFALEPGDGRKIAMNQNYNPRSHLPDIVQEKLAWRVRAKIKFLDRTI